MAKITTFIIGTIVMSLFASMIAIFLAQSASIMGITYDNTTFNNYNKLQNLSQEAESVKNEVDAIQEQSSLFDVIGAFFNQGYKALKTSIASVDVFFSITDQALEDMNIGVTGSLLRTAIVSIVLVLIIIGVVIAAIVKRDL